MPRTQRLIIDDESTVYHVMSRTALDGFPLGDIEKDFMLGLIRRYAALYQVEILGFCLMGNHFHILVRVFPEDNFTDEEILQRYVDFYGDERIFAEGLVPSLRLKLSSLSEFMREIKVGFARFYNRRHNRRHNRRGYFWGDRFKSVIVENGATLINCLAYIDLNPLRAGLVQPSYRRGNSLRKYLEGQGYIYSQPQITKYGKETRLYLTPKGKKALGMRDGRRLGGPWHRLAVQDIVKFYEAQGFVARVEHLDVDVLVDKGSETVAVEVESLSGTKDYVNAMANLMKSSRLADRVEVVVKDRQRANKLQQRIWESPLKSYRGLTIRLLKEYIKQN